LGLGAGALVGDQMQRQEYRDYDQDRVIRDQDEEIRRQQDEIDRMREERREY